MIQVTCPEAFRQAVEEALLAMQAKIVFGEPAGEGRWAVYAVEVLAESAWAIPGVDVREVEHYFGNGPLGGMAGKPLDPLEANANRERQIKYAIHGAITAGLNPMNAAIAAIKAVADCTGNDAEVFASGVAYYLDKQKREDGTDAPVGS